MKGFSFFDNDNFIVIIEDYNEACQCYRLLLSQSLSLILHYLFSWSNIDGFCYKLKKNSTIMSLSVNSYAWIIVSTLIS